MSSQRVVRAAAALLLGSLVVHELRYLLTFSHEVEATLAHHGRGYLGHVTVAVGLIGATALAGILVFLAARPGHRRRKPCGFLRLWALSSAALLAIYVGQESLESVFAPGHPAGVTAIFGAGGWVAVPAAVAGGLVISLMVRVARAVCGAGRPVRHFVVLRFSPRLAVWGPGTSRVLRGRLLAYHLAGRAPPAFSV